MAPDLSKSRSQQNFAFWLGLLLVVAIVSSPTVVAWGLQLHNDNASAKTTTPYGTLTTNHIKQVWYKSTNTTNLPISADVTNQLNVSILDASNVNGGGFAGLIVSGLTLGNISQGGSNETLPTAASELDFVTDLTVGQLLTQTVTGASYTFKVDAGGQYTKYVVGSNNTTAVDYHLATANDFQVQIGFAQGNGAVVSSPTFDKTDGSSVAANYTKTAPIQFTDLAQADLDGKDYQAKYDNPVVIKVLGFKAGTGALGSSDSIRFSTQFTEPNSPGITSYQDGVAIGFGIYGLIFIVAGIFASPFYSLRDLQRLDRRAGRFGR